MMTNGLGSTSSSRLLLQENIEALQSQLQELDASLVRFNDLGATIADLPKKLRHHVMVPLGKRAMMPGEIIRTNEIMTHLGDDYFAWQSAHSAMEVIERRKATLARQTKDVEAAVQGLLEKQHEASDLLDLKKVYEDENIKEIVETEEESESYHVTKATAEDVLEYFEIEEEERQKNEALDWNWDEAMKRMEAFEASEATGNSVVEDEMENKAPPDPAAKALALKAKGNDAFAKRKFKESLRYYSDAIECDSTSHVLYGNRAAAYHRLKQYQNALKDADVAILLCESWVKGHYRRACALAALEEYELAAAAFKRAHQLCPTDSKLEQQANDMLAKAATTRQARDLHPLQPKLPDGMMSPPQTTNTGSSKKSVSFSSDSVKDNHTTQRTRTVAAKSAFSGDIVEHDAVEQGNPLAVEKLSTAPTKATPARSEMRPRFLGNNDRGESVVLQPVGEPQPVKRVSRFKASRANNR